jgi:hypothetical protein
LTVLSRKVLRWTSLAWLAALACTATRVTPEPAAPVEQLQFEIQTATPTIGSFSDAPGGTATPELSLTPPLTATTSLTATTDITASGTLETSPAEPATDEP